MDPNDSITEFHVFLQSIDSVKSSYESKFRIFDDTIEGKLKIIGRIIDHMKVCLRKCGDNDDDNNDNSDTGSDNDNDTDSDNDNENVEFESCLEDFELFHRIYGYICF